MLVLDEQLLGHGLDVALKRWYQGSVAMITDLRPGSVIKDDAIPLLLRQLRHPTFVTINEQDFWQRVAIDDRFCVICFALPNSRVREIPALLRAVFRLPPFRTNAQRMGLVLRVSGQRVSHYGHADRAVQVSYL